MWAPIAAVLLAVGTYHTPSMITAEQAYLISRHPTSAPKCGPSPRSTDNPERRSS